MGRVATHIQGAVGWLERAGRAWEAGARTRALLDLCLAEAEVRLARKLAATEPVPTARRPAVVWLVAAGVTVVLALAGGLRWPVAPVSEKATAHASGRTLSLGYVPGSLLALVAPAGAPLAWHPAGGEDDAAAWVRAFLREAGLDTETLPAQPVSFR